MLERNKEHGGRGVGSQVPGQGLLVGGAQKAATGPARWGQTNLIWSSSMLSPPQQPKSSSPLGSWQLLSTPSQEAPVSLPRGPREAGSLPSAARPLQTPSPALDQALIQALEQGRASGRFQRDAQGAVPGTPAATLREAPAWSPAGSTASSLQSLWLQQEGPTQASDTPSLLPPSPGCAAASFGG